MTIIYFVFTAIFVLWLLYLAAAFARSLWDALMWCRKKLWPRPTFGQWYERRMAEYWRQEEAQQLEDHSSKGGFFWKPRPRRRDS